MTAYVGWRVGKTRVTRDLGQNGTRPWWKQPGKPFTPSPITNQCRSQPSALLHMRVPMCQAWGRAKAQGQTKPDQMSFSAQTAWSHPLKPPLVPLLSAETCGKKRERLRRAQIHELKEDLREVHFSPTDSQTGCNLVRSTLTRASVCWVAGARNPLPPSRSFDERKQAVKSSRKVRKFWRTAPPEDKTAKGCD